MQLNLEHLSSMEMIFFEMPLVSHAHGKLFINITYYVKEKKTKLRPW